MANARRSGGGDEVNSVRPAAIHPRDPFFARAAARLTLDASGGEDGDFALNPDLARSRDDWRDAAVLVPVVDRAEPGVLLTRRTAGLAAHAGQVAFPGGKIDPEDATPIACALREAEEEIGLDPALVEPIGFLPTYLTGTGFRVHPLVARIAPDFVLVPNEAEVAAVFEVPLAFLMTPANHRRASRMFAGRERFFYEIPFGEHYIWGATAGIIRGLYERVIA